MEQQAGLRRVVTENGKPLIVRMKMHEHHTRKYYIEQPFTYWHRPGRAPQAFFGYLEVSGKIFRKTNFFSNGFTNKSDWFPGYFSFTKKR
jgi:hypothetical protein